MKRGVAVPPKSNAFVAVGMGSKLISKDILASKEYDKITELTRQAIEMIKEIRSSTN